MEIVSGCILYSAQFITYGKRKPRLKDVDNRIRKVKGLNKVYIQKKLNYEVKNKRWILNIRTHKVIDSQDNDIIFNIYKNELIKLHAKYSKGRKRNIVNGFQKVRGVINPAYRNLIEGEATNKIYIPNFKHKRISEKELLKLKNEITAALEKKFTWFQRGSD